MKKKKKNNKISTLLLRTYVTARNEQHQIEHFEHCKLLLQYQYTVQKRLPVLYLIQSLYRKCVIVALDFDDVDSGTSVTNIEINLKNN